MRYFLRRSFPSVNRVLLVESGSRSLIEGVIPGLRQAWGENTPIDVATCYAGAPAGFRAEDSRVYRVTDYRGREGRRTLYRELAANRYAVMGIVCSGEAVMAKWKWALVLRVPAKVFLLNENGDYFWLDRDNLATVWSLLAIRSGLAGAGAVRTVVRLISFPFTLLYLLLYATTVHARRALRRG